MEVYWRVDFIDVELAATMEKVAAGPVEKATAGPTTTELIITAATFTVGLLQTGGDTGSYYEPLVKSPVHKTNRRTIGDGRPIFTAMLHYESAVKITFTNGLTCAAA
jgi:hypothetical protein